MKKLNLLSLLIIGLLLCSAISATEVSRRSLYTDIKAHNIGDLITVFIMEDSKAVNKAKTTTKKQSDMATEGSAGLGPLDFIPLWGASGSDQMDYSGQGQTEKSGSLRAKLTATVIEIRQNGDLVIEGSRVVTINDEDETMFLSGIVRPRDISENNMVYSYQIADAKISSKGKGVVTEGQRPGFVTRLLNWIF